jgi:hypothetical protein
MGLATTFWAIFSQTRVWSPWFKKVSLDGRQEFEAFWSHSKKMSLSDRRNIFSP